MATDAYIKFGESSDKSPYDTLLPAIEGDSTDFNHYWWCELRGYDFALDAGERDSASEGDKSKEKPKPTFHKVTIKKRVDWASTQLFTKCCAAAQATARKLTGDQDQGLIDRVTIEICKQAAESKKGPSDPKDDKFWFVTVRYFGVRIVGYTIDMSRPEPDETITFVFEKLDVEYQQTDPRTGLRINGAVSRAIGMPNYTNANPQSAQSSGAGTSTTTSASTGAAAAAAAGAAGGADGNGAPANNGSSGNPSPTEAAVNANFPGLWGGNGFGILPD
jgi:type VI protein secretion system component Hcp